MTKVNYKKLLIIAISFLMLMFLVGCSEYKPEAKSPQIQQPHIISDGVLKVGVNADSAPFAGDSSKLEGIDCDVAYALADGLGLKAEIIDVGHDGANALINKKIDILMGVDMTKSLDSKCWKSESYLETAPAIFSLNKLDPFPTEKDISKIAAVKGEESSQLAQKLYGSEAMKFESNYQACFDSLKNNRVSYVAADAVTGTYAAGKSDVECSMIGLLAKPSGYCFAALETNVVLQTKAAVVLQNLKKTEALKVIECKWLGKNLKLSEATLVPGASNQADMSDVEKASE